MILAVVDPIKNTRSVVVNNMKKINDSIENQIVITDALLRITAIEKILIDKGIVTSDELLEVSSELAQKIAKDILKKANVNGDIDAIVSELKYKKDTN